MQNTIFPSEMKWNKSIKQYETKKNYAEILSTCSATFYCAHIYIIYI